MLGDGGLAEEIAALATQVNRATHRLLTCIRRFDEAEDWGAYGAKSCAHWLTWRIGLDRATAREKVRVARALGGLPQIDEALAQGRLSYAKVRAVTRIATSANEARVLETAMVATGAQLERICRGMRQATADEAEMARKRRFRGQALGDGLVKLEMVLSADEAEVVVQAVEQARAARAGSTAADGLMEIVSTFIAERASGPGSAAGPGTPATPGVELVIHLEPTLTDSETTLAGTLEDGRGVSAEALRRAACDSGVVVAVVKDGGVLDVGRRTRAIPVPIRRALSVRDHGCRFPGCTSRRFLHGHHVQHWLHGGRTSLDNLVLLCAFHHRLVHEGGFSIALTADGQVVVKDPGGRLLEGGEAPPTGGDVIEWGGGVWDDHDTMTPPSWDGEPVDYHAVVDALL